MSMFSTNINSAVTHITICGLIAFMYHTNLIFEEISQDLESLAGTTNSELVTLRDCTRSIQTGCTDCNQQVKDMKEALVLAGGAQSFDMIDVAEMKEVCQTLLNEFQVLAETNKRVNDQGKLFKERLSKTIEMFGSSRKLYQWKYRAMGGFVGGAMGCVVGGMLTESILGTFAGVCTTELGTYCTSYSKNRTEIILRKIVVNANKIKSTAYDSIEIMGDIVFRLEVQFRLAEKNDRAKAKLGFRIKRQVDEMIEDICSLRKSLYEMKRKAKVNERYIENILRLENVVDLLNL